MRLAPVTLVLAATLAAISAAPAGAHHPLEGTLIGVHADYFEEGGSSTSWRLDTGDDTVPVLPTSLPALAPGDAEVKLEAEAGEDAAVGAVSAATPVAAPSPGQRSLAVIMVNFHGDTRQPWTSAQVDQAAFTGPSSLDAFYEEESYGDIGFSGDVYGWYTLGPDVPTSGCPYTTWGSKARQAAAADGFDASQYDHVMYVFPTQSSCGWAGLAYLPGWQSWINGELTIRVMGHEIGHNLGLNHAGRLDCGPATIDESCSLNEYGDPFDVMGSYGDRHSHSWHLEKLGVLTGQNVQTATASGTYSIRSALLETADAKTLRIPRTRDSNGNVLDWYYLEIREPGGVFEDFNALDFAVNGVSIRLVDDPSDTTVSRLLDTHPGSGSGVWDSALPAGETFTDGEVSVTTVSAATGLATVAVTVPSGTPADTQPPSAPTGVQSTVTSASVALGWTPSSDDTGVARYVVNRDGVAVGTAGSPFFVDYSASAGQHVYTVYAEDAAANRSAGSSPHVVSVPGAPVPGTGPATGDTSGTGTPGSATAAADTISPRAWLRTRRLAGGRLLLSAGANDDRSVARLQLWIDGSLRRSRAGAALRYRWRVSRGRHRIVVRALDPSGNAGTLERRLRKR